MMLRLPILGIVELVRKNLDEIAGHETQMLGADYDDRQDIVTIVSGCVPEAVRQVHLEADASLVEGREATEADYEVTGNVITMKVPVLRIASFKAVLSPYSVSEVYPENSPTGRMQINPYVSGIFDSPVLIEKSVNAGAHRMVLEYHSFKDESDAVEHISYVPYPERGAMFYEVSPKLLDAFVGRLTSMVKEIYGKQ